MIIDVGGKMQAYIFDLDGTLFDSMGVWRKIDDNFFGKRGLVCPEDYASAILPMPFDESSRYTIERFGLSETPEEVQQEWLDLAIHAYTTEVDFKPGAKDYLGSLLAKGVKLAVATSLPKEIMIPTLHKHGIYHIFHAICTAQDVGCGKNKPDVFILAAKELGVTPEDCLLYDDILPAVRSAKSIGMKVCAVYDETSADNWDEIQKIADCTIMDFKELV